MLSSTPTTVLDYGIWLKLSAEELEQLPPYQAPASDRQLTAMLQRSLETDPQTRDAGLRAEVHGGVVNFLGAAAADMVEAARKLARRLRGVIGFADELQEAPELPAPPLRIGAPICATNGRYGTLDKVIVDPHARRVTHLVVRKGWLLTENALSRSRWSSAPCPTASTSRRRRWSWSSCRPTARRSSSSRWRTGSRWSPTPSTTRFSGADHT
ncbi:MAG: BON domain-containing protein [Chloroflexales bacterium]|nr:BON domain-containing protein [Chloroflexales bacterium]